MLIPGIVNYPKGVLAIMYTLTLIYLFFGVSIIADKFMEGIDASLPWSERKRLMLMQKKSGSWGDQTVIAPNPERVDPNDPAEKVSRDGGGEEEKMYQRKEGSKEGKDGCLDG